MTAQVLHPSVVSADRDFASHLKSQLFTDGGDVLIGLHVVVVVGLPLLFLGMEVWREQQSRFTPST